MAQTSTAGQGLDAPLLDLHTTADQLVPVEQENAFAARVRAAGDARLLRQGVRRTAGPLRLHPERGARRRCTRSNTASTPGAGATPRPPRSALASPPGPPPSWTSVPRDFVDGDRTTAPLPTAAEKFPGLLARISPSPSSLKDATMSTTTGSPAAENTAQRSPLALGTLIACCLAVCLAQIGVAIPATLNGLFQQDLHPVGSQLTWISDAFLLPVSVLELTFGVLGDLFGRKRLLVGGAVLLGLGEITSASSHGVHLLWVGQALSGHRRRGAVPHLAGDDPAPAPAATASAPGSSRSGPGCSPSAARSPRCSADSPRTTAPGAGRSSSWRSWPGSARW